MDLAHPALHLALAAALAVAALAARAVAGSRGARRGGRWFAAADAALVAGLCAEAAALGVESLGSGVAGWLEVLGGIAGVGGGPRRVPIVTPEAVAALHTVAATLVLAWPPLALRGARRFFARGRSRVPPWTDAAVWAAAVAAVVAAAHAAPAGGWLDERFVLAPALAAWREPALGAAAATALLLGWLAFALTRLGDFALHRECRTLALLAAVAASGLAAAVGVDWHGAAAAGRAPLAVDVAPFLASALLALVATHLRLAMNHARDVEHLRDKERKLKALADVDALTGLPNRRHFHALASKAVEQTAATATSTVLLFDVDGMRRVNAVLGQVTADEALAQIGTTLRETLRRRDVAGRIGDDEFAVLLPRTCVADADVVIARIHARVADRQVAPRLAPVRLSVGTAEIRPGLSLAETLRKAELSLQAARDAERRREAALTPALSRATGERDAASRGSARARSDETRSKGGSTASPARAGESRAEGSSPPPALLAAARSLQRAADAVDQPRSETTGQPRDAASAAGRGSGSTPTGRPTASSNDRSFAESL